MVLQCTIMCFGQMALARLLEKRLGRPSVRSGHNQPLALCGRCRGYNREASFQSTRGWKWCVNILSSLSRTKLTCVKPDTYVWVCVQKMERACLDVRRPESNVDEGERGKVSETRAPIVTSSSRFDLTLGNEFFAFPSPLGPIGC